MTIEGIYFILSIQAFIFGAVTLVMVSFIREYERHYNRSGVTAFMVALLVADAIALLYALFYGGVLLPQYLGGLTQVSGMLQGVIDYGLYFLMAVIFLISAYLLRKR